MNNNGIAVLAGILLISMGLLNSLYENVRIIVSIAIVSIGIFLIIIGITIDRIE